jgi:hypothetical protein
MLVVTTPIYKIGPQRHAKGFLVANSLYNKRP